MPNEKLLQEINSCNFKSRYCDDYDYPGSSKGYYYKIPLSYSRSNYLIIKYSGSNNYGTIKARGSFSTFIEKIKVNISSDTSLTKYSEIFNYFYGYIDYNKHDYVYFYFNDSYINLYDPIYYCKTDNNPEYYFSIIRDCRFLSLSYDEKNPTSNYNYSYKVDVSTFHGGYVIVRYSVGSSYNSLYVKGLYNISSKSLSTLAIVFIVIAGVVFIGILITIICCFCCKRRAANNITYVPTQPATKILPKTDEVIQTPTYPLVEKNICIKTIN